MYPAAADIVCVCVSLSVLGMESHRDVGAKATVDAEAAVAQEDAKGRGREAWVALSAVRACLVGGQPHLRVQSLHCFVFSSLLEFALQRLDARRPGRGAVVA